VPQQYGTSLHRLAGTILLEPVAHLRKVNDLSKILLHQCSSLNGLARPKPPPAMRCLEHLDLRILALLQRAIAALAIVGALNALNPRGAVYAAAGAAVGAGLAIAKVHILARAFRRPKRVYIFRYTRVRRRFICRGTLQLKLAEQHASMWPEGV